MTTPYVPPICGTCQRLGHRCETHELEWLREALAVETQARQQAEGCAGNCSCAVWHSRHEAAMALYQTMDKLKASEVARRALIAKWRGFAELCDIKGSFTGRCVLDCADDLAALLSSE